MINILIWQQKSMWFHAWQALSIHKLRSLLSSLGIVFAVLAMVIMLAIAAGAKREAVEMIGRLGINSIIIKQIPLSDHQVDTVRRQQIEGLSLRDLALLEHLPNVSTVTTLSEVRATISEVAETEMLSVLSVSPGYFQIKELVFATGRPIIDFDEEKMHQICVLGAGVADRLGLIGALDGGILHINQEPHRIVGVLRNRELNSATTGPLLDREINSAVFIPRLPSAELSAAADDYSGFSEIIVTVIDPSLIEATTSAVRHVLLWKRDGVENFTILIPQELLQQAMQTQRLFNVVLGGIASISLLVGGIGIMNIMLANVSERINEIGIRRAIGASRKHIAVQFMGESILLTVVGGVLGVITGIIAAYGVDFFVKWPTHISLWSIVLAILMSIGVGIVSGLYPAIKAAKMDPVKALRFA